jgi:hypothetical protein
MDGYKDVLGRDVSRQYQGGELSKSNAKAFYTGKAEGLVESKD